MGRGKWGQQDDGIVPALIHPQKHRFNKNISNTVPLGEVQNQVKKLQYVRWAQIWDQPTETVREAISFYPQQPFPQADHLSSERDCYSFLEQGVWGRGGRENRVKISRLSLCFLTGLISALTHRVLRTDMVKIAGIARGLLVASKTASFGESTKLRPFLQEGGRSEAWLHVLSLSVHSPKWLTL